MQTKTLIQAQANVIKITNLKKGDVIKILEKEYSDYETFYGIVLDLLNNGNKTFIQILKYKMSYGDVESFIKTYSGEDEMNLFPATTKEVGEYLKNSIKRCEEDIKEEKDKLHKKIEGLEKAKEFTSGELSKKLTEASFTEIDQKEYDRKKQELLN